MNAISFLNFFCSVTYPLPQLGHGDDKNSAESVNQTLRSAPINPLAATYFPPISTLVCDDSIFCKFACICDSPLRHHLLSLLPGYDLNKCLTQPRRSGPLRKQNGERPPDGQVRAASDPVPGTSDSHVTARFHGPSHQSIRRRIQINRFWP